MPVIITKKVLIFDILTTILIPIVLLIICLLSLPFLTVTELWFISGLLGLLIGRLNFRKCWRKRDYFCILFGFITLFASVKDIIIKRKEFDHIHV